MSNQTNEEPEKSHVDRIRDLVVGTAKAPVTVAGSAVGMAGSAVGLAKDAASAGLAAGGHVLKAVTSTALGAVAPNAQDDTQPNPTDVEPETPTSRAPSAGQPSESKDESAQSDQTQSDQAESGSTDADALEIAPDEPVNVTEELGLDPSPIAKPKRKKAPAKKPATKIDAAADTSQVTATPADVAKVADKDLSASEQDVEQPDGDNV